MTDQPKEEPVTDQPKQAPWAFKVGDIVAYAHSLGDGASKFRVVEIRPNGHLHCIAVDEWLTPTGGLPAWFRLIESAPEPYVPQVGDVVEWTVDNADGADVRAGDRGVVVSTAPHHRVVEVRPDVLRRHARGDGLWTAVPESLRLIERPAVAPAPEPKIDTSEKPIPDLPKRCPRGHRAYQGLLFYECPTCEAIAEVERSEPLGMWQETRRGETRWRVRWLKGCDEPTRDGAIALWRASEMARLDEEGKK